MEASPARQLQQFRREIAGPKAFAHGQAGEQALDANSNPRGISGATASRFRAHKENPRAADAALYKQSAKNRRNNLLSNIASAAGA